MSPPTGKEQLSRLGLTSPEEEVLRFHCSQKEGRGKAGGIRVMSYNIHHGTGVSGELD